LKIENNRTETPMKRLFFLLSSLLFTVALFSQREETVFGRNGLRLTGFWISPTIGLSSFDDNFVSTKGGSVGFEFNKNLLIGWRGFETNDGFVLTNQNDHRFDLKYNALLLGFIPKAQRVVHPQFLFVMGSGELSDQDGLKDNIFVVQPSGGFEINIFRWFRLGFEAGYRFVMQTNLPGLNDADVSSPFGEMKFKFGWSWGR